MNKEVVSVEIPGVLPLRIFHPRKFDASRQYHLSFRKLAGHDTSPTMVDWDKNGIPDLLAGAEDGHFYYLKR